MISIRSSACNGVASNTVRGTTSSLRATATPSRRTPLEGYYVAAGHYRNGILLAPLIARALAETILDGASHVSLEPFAVGRDRPGSPGIVAKTRV